MSPLPTLPAFRIAVLGGGNIGSAFAFQLARTGGHDVTVIARPGSARLEQLRRDGGIVNVGGERARADVADALDLLVPYELVIVTVPAHQLEPLLPALRQCAARTILFMFNNFEPERLAAAVGAQRCSFGMPFVQAKLNQAGWLRLSMGAKTRLGCQRWVDLFAAAGIPAVHEPDMPLWLRCHVPLCVAFESIAVAAVRRDGGATWAEAARIARGAKAGFSLIQAMGYRLHPSGKARLGAYPHQVLAAMLWTMSRIRPFCELLASGESECRALVEVMQAAANGATLPALAAGLEGAKPAPPPPPPPPAGGNG
ncbi:2-dehydropantoate 2-reductase [Duganella sp. CF517]|uniref:ketopantoate reductase family protein n=1 Tax=Duganella sp. CF517 TaxID=1881038 RepID=UPI0008D6A59D|nr:2-dehydropantoate 2-reductase N-terminal domain-containing protein [Duganella sp. CF517]SEO08732.1 2-dehydropantoate 2-reductase [Duganella sp. CF517]